MLLLIVENISRACLNCGIVKGFVDFLQEGCINCEEVLKLKNDPKRIQYLTTSSFRRLFIIPEGYKEWGTAVIPLASFKYGVYAYDVQGEIPHELLCELLH